MESGLRGAIVTRFRADETYVEGGFQRGLDVVADGDEITRVEASAGEADRVLHGRALLPGCVNAHNHSFQSLVRGVSDDLAFLGWRDRGIYRVAPRMTADAVYTGALFAFGEMLRYGVTTVADFFYLNAAGNENARAVIRAARAVGIRLVLARCFYDWDGAPAAYRETPDLATARTRELVDEFREARDVSVIPAPHSVHGASPAMIEAAVKLAREMRVPFHIHLAEGQYEGNECWTRHGVTPLGLLERLGALSSALVAVHGVWLDEHDREKFAAAGAKLIYCPSSNLFLGDGLTPVRELMRAGVCVALGTDGACSNNRVSIFDEMRTTALLQKVRALDAAAFGASDVLAMGFANGGTALGQPVGRIAPGFRADFVAVDTNDLSLLPPNHLEKHVVYSLTPYAVREVFVGGELVASSGALLRIPESEIAARVRSLSKVLWA